MNATVPVAASAPAAPAKREAPPVDPGDKFFVVLAREIAMDMHELDVILKNHDVDQARWDQIVKNPRFQMLLTQQVTEWNNALNTQERVKLKALACLEEAMPEMFQRMHDPQETLPAKVKIFEVLGNVAGMGKNQQGGAVTGEKFSVTINLGTDKPVQVIADTPKTIQAIQIDQ